MQLRLEKQNLLADPDNPRVRVLVHEEELDGQWMILDVTHHDNERAADAYIATQWNIVSPPEFGTVLQFEAQPTS